MGSLLVLYLLALVWLVVFRDVNSVADIYMSAEERTLNLIPFKYNYIGEIIHNIILFIPIGIYISALDFSNIVGRISAITCFGIFLELSKFFLVIGAFDITNIISNAIGGCLGSFVYIAIYFFKKDFGLWFGEVVLMLGEAIKLTETADIFVVEATYEGISQTNA